MHDKSRDMQFNKIVNSLTVISGCAQLAAQADHPDKLIHYFKEIIGQMDKLLILLLELDKKNDDYQTNLYPISQFRQRNARPPLIVL